MALSACFTIFQIFSFLKKKGKKNRKLRLTICIVVSTPDTGNSIDIKYTLKLIQKIKSSRKNLIYQVTNTCTIHHTTIHIIPIQMFKVMRLLHSIWQLGHAINHIKTQCYQLPFSLRSIKVISLCNLVAAALHTLIVHLIKLKPDNDFFVGFVPQADVKIPFYLLDVNFTIK